MVTQGRTLDEVARSLCEAVDLHLADEDLGRGPIDDGDVEIDEIRRVVRGERRPESFRESGDQEIGIIMRSTAMSLLRPQLCRRDPHGAVVVDPLKGLDEGIELGELTIGTAVA